MPTIKEVARRAGVSVGTVSNVLGGTVPVSKLLKKRVLEVIKQLDYHPDHVARSLKIRQTRTIGLVVNNISDALFPEIMRGADDAAWNASYLLITFNSDDQPERERQVIEALRSRRVDGILLVAVTENDVAHVRAVQDAGIPVVCIDRELSGGGLDAVVVNHFEGARACVHHLVSHGYKRIGLVNSSVNTSVARDHKAGFLRGLDEAGLPFDQNLLLEVPPSRDASLDAARRLLSAAAPPLALMAGTMMLGLALLQIAREIDLRLPQDLALMLFEDPHFTEAFRPPLTAVAQPGYELGQKAVKLLLDRIREPKRRRTKLVLEPTLRIRESCGAPGL